MCYLYSLRVCMYVNIYYVYCRCIHYPAGYKRSDFMGLKNNNKTKRSTVQRRRFVSGSNGFSLCTIKIACKYYDGPVRRLQVVFGAIVSPSSFFSDEQTSRTHRRYNNNNILI